MADQEQKKRVAEASSKDEIGQLADALGVPPEEMAVLDAGNEHAYGCECSKCLHWWRLMGPNPGEDLSDPYGPFAIERVEDDSEDGQKCRTARLLMHIDRNERTECLRFDGENGFVLKWSDERGHWVDGDLVFKHAEDFWPEDRDGKRLKGRLEWNDAGGVSD